MKKIERLRWIESVFGTEFVLKYFYCGSWKEILTAIDYFESHGKGWGMRTDTNEGNLQKNLCPFLHKGSREAALKIWEANQERLYYIVCENLLEVLCHGVAHLVDKEHIFIEFNDKETGIAQRNMYESGCKNLRHIDVGPSSYIFKDSLFVKTFHPEEVMDYGFDKIYYLLMFTKAKEITFSVTPDKQIIIW